MSIYKEWLNNWKMVLQVVQFKSIISGVIKTFLFNLIIKYIYNGIWHEYWNVKSHVRAKMVTILKTPRHDKNSTDFTKKTIFAEKIDI